MRPAAHYWLLALLIGALVPEAGAHAQSARDSELDCIARAVYFESGGEPREGQIGVAMVIVNRMRHGRFPSTACAVIDNGFYFPRDRAITMEARWVQAWHIAEGVLEGGLTVPSLRGALYFHGVREKPDWRFRAHHLATIGGHIFYGE